MKISWSIVIVGVTVIGALVWVLGKGFGRDPHEVPFMLTGKMAPELKLERIDQPGKAIVTSAELLKDKPIVLNFWSTWCQPCKQEHPVLEWGHEKFGDKVSFVGVVYQDSMDNVDGFFKTTPPRWLMLFDPQGRAAVDYGLAGVPETYFIAKDGRIQYKHVGPLSPALLSQHVNELLTP